jgi:hypothetical protein
MLHCNCGTERRATKGSTLAAQAQQQITHQFVRKGPQQNDFPQPCAEHQCHGPTFHCDSKGMLAGIINSVQINLPGTTASKKPRDVGGG